MPDHQMDELRAPSYLIFMGAFSLTILCTLGVVFGIPFVSEYASNLIEQICLLVGVNAALVMVATYFVILVGKVKRGL